MDLPGREGAQRLAVGVERPDAMGEAHVAVLASEARTTETIGM
jgi:hypothetical protein